VRGTILDAEGREVLGRRKGYRYFGQAKELPGIKEVFERAAKRRVTGGDNDDEKRIVTNSGPLVLGSVSVLAYGLATSCLLYLVGLLPFPLFFRFVALV
jgi:hypothetical protein